MSANHTVHENTAHDNTAHDDTVRETSHLFRARRTTIDETERVHVIGSGARVEAPSSNGAAVRDTAPRHVGRAPMSALANEDFDALYRESWHAMVHLATLLTSSRPVAEDVVQEAFVATYRRWSRMTDRAGAAAYIRTAVVNGTRSHHRRQRTRRRFLQSETTEERPAISVESSVTESQHLRAAVATLPRRQREVVVLRYWLDLSEADIARTLRISRGTVKSSAARGLAQLEKSIRSTP